MSVGSSCMHLHVYPPIYYVSLYQAGKKPEIAREPGLIFFKIVREIFKTVREHLSAGPKGRFTSTPEGPRSRGMARGVGLQGRGVPFPYARIFFLITEAESSLKR